MTGNETRQNIEGLPNKSKSLSRISSCLKNAAKITGLVALVGVPATLFTKLMIEQAEIYSGPSDISGVSHINSRQLHRSDLGFYYRIYNGNRTDVTFTTGSTASIRDYNGDFLFNGKDTVTGKIPNGIDLNDILMETRTKAGKHTYLNFM